jgi:hypothetical protein
MTLTVGFDRPRWSSGAREPSAFPAEGMRPGQRLPTRETDDGLSRQRPQVAQSAVGQAKTHKRACRLLDRIKRDKGVWWMPWQQEAMKDVALCDKPGGGESTLRSRDVRMGKPT